MPNSPDTILYMRKKKEVFAEYRKYYEKKSSLRDVVGIDGELFSQDYFYKTWKETYTNLKLRADGDFMKCYLCSLHKGEIYGGGGQDTARMEVLRAKYEEHLKEVQLDRDVIAKLRILSRDARARGTPHLHVLMSCDGANQCNFATPLFGTRAHGIDDKGWAERGKVYGVLVDDAVMDVLFVPQVLGGGEDIFSRQQMANEFQEAYQKVEVRRQILENMANFKDLVALVTRRIHLITNFQGFHLFREGEWIVVVVKLKMHDEDWLGFSSDGKKVGSGPDFKPWRLMLCNDMRLEEAPPYHLKEVPDEVINQVQMRQEASWMKLPGAYPADYDRQEQVKQEHRESIRTLMMTGSRSFDLDTAWLPPLEIDDDGDEDDGPSVDEGGAGMGETSFDKYAAAVFTPDFVKNTGCAEDEEEDEEEEDQQETCESAGAESQLQQRELTRLRPGGGGQKRPGGGVPGQDWPGGGDGGAAAKTGGGGRGEHQVSRAADRYSSSQ
eukprot:g19900.t1